MKKLLLVGSLLAFAFTTPVVFGAEDASYYKAGEVNVSVYGGVTTPDFDAERASVGASLGLFLTQNFGVEVEGFAGDTDGQFVDQAAVQLVYRIPVRKSAPYGFAGVFHNFENDQDLGVSVGLGVEHRFTKNFGIFADARLEKFINSGDPQARARSGIRVAF